MTETEVAATYIKLDYSLKDLAERHSLVESILTTLPKDRLTEGYLEILTDYLILPTKEEKKEKELLTKNRLVTINKRETSFEDIVSKFENGEDGVYNISIEDDKNVLLTPKISISPRDIEEVPNLKELREAIERTDTQVKSTSGKRKYMLKKQLIEMQREQYTLKNSFYGLTFPKNAERTARALAQADLSEDITFTSQGLPQSNGLVSFFDKDHISALLCAYSSLKENAEGRFTSDIWATMLDLDNAIEIALKDDYPLYYMLLIYKIDGKGNLEIQELLDEEFGVKHSVEYISALWRNKIPKLIAESEMARYLNWYYTTQEYGKWKKCSRCEEVKLVHNMFFSKNSTSKDGYYSICKECRNKKNKEDRIEKQQKEGK